jgi:large subunit ribosomal protein L35
MAYKFKPNKSMAKRFRVSKTGKLVHSHAFHTHLLSNRSGNRKRHLTRPAVLFEGHARNLRKMMGLGKLQPGKTAHQKALAGKKKETQPQGT